MAKGSGDVSVNLGPGPGLQGPEVEVAAFRDGYAAETDRQIAADPSGAGEPGVVLAAGDLASLGMSGDAVVPDPPPLQQPEDYRS